MDAVKRRAVKTLVGKLTSASEQTRTEAICELRLLSKNDPETRPLIADADAVPLIAESLYSPSPILQENAAAALLNLSISSKDHLISHAARRPGHALPRAAAPGESVHGAALGHGDLQPAERGVVPVDHRAQARHHIRAGGDRARALFGVALYPLFRAQMVVKVF
ncbi:hypothetical protein SASPL_121010 [Salvia splendens]|uniref:Vacuolar protein 8 n=1 Tax=Salvia splendens TaxID=180675 RepID=A0A8X8XVB3_SALSN|nr:U-box domain-containing protein 15-like [Salvia splendens]KAG6418805.1 hypothetical protein SASPL_121010 [Salvia splendens]